MQQESLLLGLIYPHRSAGHANRVIDPGTAAFSVPSVQPADSSGSGPADQ